MNERKEGFEDREQGVGKMGNERIKILKKEIADLKSQWPAHSVPPAMLLQLDELEEELEKEIQREETPLPRSTTSTDHNDN